MYSFPGVGDCPGGRSGLGPAHSRRAAVGGRYRSKSLGLEVAHRGMPTGRPARRTAALLSVLPLFPASSDLWLSGWVVSRRCVCALLSSGDDVIFRHHRLPLHSLVRGYIPTSPLAYAQIVAGSSKIAAILGQLDLQLYRNCDIDSFCSRFRSDSIRSGHVRSLR